MGSSVNYGVEMEARVRVTINDPDVIERVTGPGGDEWRSRLYSSIKTERDVLNHLAYNAIANGATNLKHLDGWADLDPDAAEMSVVDVEENWTSNGPTREDEKATA
jgi:hypothetical protein